MKYLLVTIAVVVQIWTAASVPAPFSFGTAALAGNLDDFINTAQAQVLSASDHIKELISKDITNEKNSRAVFDKVKENSEKVAVRLTDVIDKLKQQIEETENSETMKNIHDKLQKTIESMKEELTSANVKEKAKEVEENFANSLNVIVEEAGKLSKLVKTEGNINDDLHQLSNQVVAEAVFAADSVQDAVQDAINQEQWQ